MPILVKDYTWTQSAKLINIRVPLNPVSHEKVDLFTTDSYIKANFNPFLFEIFLLHDINSEKSKCVIKDDVIILDMVKRENIEWECLEKELTKPEKMKLKHEIIEKSQEEAKKKAEDKQIKKTQLDRFTVQQAMDIDTKQHALMDSRRDAERNKAMNALEEWRVNIEDKKESNPIPKLNENSGVKIVELPSSEDESDTENKKEMKRPTVNKKTKPQKATKTPVRSEYVEKKKQEAAKRVLPRLRETAELEVSHTPRSFPTPSRESTANEEQAWVKNITLARRAIGKNVFSWLHSLLPIVYYLPIIVI